MIELLILAASIFLLALLILFLPLRLSWKGKGSILLCSILISLMGYYGSTILSLWTTLPMMILLAALLAYLIMKRGNIFQEKEFINNKDKSFSTIEPLFSYDQLRENAEQAETIDFTYTDPARLNKGHEDKIGFGTMDQAEIDRLLGFDKGTDGLSEDFVAAVNVPPLDSWTEDEPQPQDHEMEILEERTFDIEEEKQEPNVSYVTIDQIEAILNQEVEEEVDVIEEINLENRTFADLADKEVETLAVDDELDLIEIRKKLFADLGDGDDDHQPIEEVQSNIVEEIIPPREFDFVDLEDSFISIDEPEQEAEEPDHRLVINREVAAAFDDLEEMYLKKKTEDRENKEDGT